MVVRACQKHPDIYSSYTHPANTTFTVITNDNISTTAPPTRPRPSRTARQIPIDLAGPPEAPMPDSVIAATYRGHVASTQDALIVIEACLRGVLYHTCRRPRSSEESSLAKSGNIFVYERGSSGIRSWEDGITWSTPQRVGNFEICRQLSSSSGRSRSNGNHSSSGRLCRKTISVTVRGITHHLVAYFSSRDFTSNTLMTPSADFGLADIIPRPELYSQGFRAPLEEDDRDEVMLLIR
ncbi:hypothetical protein KVR01_003943 [Diaporthe batatas]|uniref:uncharacterized protein n=1 Tax=Diaporthe batatas TaxID=748121 RepID=UPI001D04C6BD|nr:uncharacterized protein KVR01_003943 [Diaporthe batatas]KAG8168254.1 hypothetical protein KVR01_003943 [Diaporthe batatas]